MRRALILCIASCAFAFAATSEEKDPTATVQRLFDAMAAHDADAGRPLFAPGTTLTAVRADGTVSTITSDQFLTHVGAAKEPWLERMWEPKVMVHGSLAVVWADYDFHLNGKLSHCGVDSITLVNTAGEWKIAGVAYTSETSGCAPSPLGPPKK